MGERSDEDRETVRRPKSETQTGAERRRPALCVLAATPQLTVTIESSAPTGEPELHVHPGGQGLWTGRMATVLGAGVVVCGPFGGETGRLAEHLAAQESMTIRATGYGGSNGSYVHDRRDGERTEVVRTTPAPLSRHELDDLFGTVLIEALDADVVVLTGAEPAQTVPADFFERLAADLRSQGRTVVADLSGDAAQAAIGTGVDVLKMSHSEMLDDGLASGDDVAALLRGARKVIEGGVRALVVSRADQPTLLVTDEQAVLLTSPSITTVDHRGAGDSMTAGIAVGLGRGADLLDAVRLGAAAGALNATRHGLGSGRREQIERFADEIAVEDAR